jgi:hypothetical protein
MLNPRLELWDMDNPIKRIETSYEVQFSINPILKDKIEKI